MNDLFAASSEKHIVHPDGAVMEDELASAIGPLGLLTGVGIYEICTARNVSQ